MRKLRKYYLTCTYTFLSYFPSMSKSLSLRDWTSHTLSPFFSYSLPHCHSPGAYTKPQVRGYFLKL